MGYGLSGKYVHALGARGAIRKTVATVATVATNGSGRF